MTDDQIRKAAAEAFDRTLTEGALSRIEAVYRAGMEAGRAEASKRSLMISGADSAGDMAAFLRRLENDPEEVARLMGGAGATKTKRRKETKGDAVGVDEIVQAGADRQHAEDWMRVRKQHKAPLTRTSWEAMGREAAKAGFTIGQAVQMCAERGWRGFRSEYVSGGNQHARPAESFQSQAALARVQRIAPGAARKDAEPQKNWLQKWNEVIDDAGQPRLR